MAPSAIPSPPLAGYSHGAHGRSSPHSVTRTPSILAVSDHTGWAYVVCVTARDRRPFVIARPARSHGTCAASRSRDGRAIGIARTRRLQVAACQQLSRLERRRTAASEGAWHHDDRRCLAPSHCRNRNQRFAVSRGNCIVFAVSPIRARRKRGKLAPGQFGVRSNTRACAPTFRDTGQ